MIFQNRQAVGMTEFEKSMHGLPHVFDIHSEQGNWTWDTFLSLARAFQNSGDGKFAIDGYHPENEFLTSTGTPLVGNDGTQIINNMYSPNVERAENLLATLQKENLRYPRHELNNWSTNPKAWASGDTLFWADGGTWVYENTISPFVEKFGWADDEVKVVPFPRDPQADKYYHFMKQDSLMWCKGSDYADGVAAWIDCCATTAADPDTAEAATKQYMEKYNWSKENLDFINSLTKLDGTSPITPIFDFKNGLGSDISSNDTSESNVEQLTKYVYLQGDQTSTQLRETNFAPIQARIDDINKEISENS